MMRHMRRLSRCVLFYDNVDGTKTCGPHFNHHRHHHPVTTSSLTHHRPTSDRCHICLCAGMASSWYLHHCEHRVTENNTNQNNDVRRTPLKKHTCSTSTPHHIIATSHPHSCQTSAATMVAQPIALPRQPPTPQLPLPHWIAIHCQTRPTQMPLAVRGVSHLVHYHPLRQTQAMPTRANVRYVLQQQGAKVAQMAFLTHTPTPVCCG